MPEFFLSLTLPPKLVLIGVLLLAIGFLLFYVLPAFSTASALGRARREVERLQPEGTKVIATGTMKQAFQRDKRLRHAWEEYSETLHGQHRNVDGEQTLIALRATVPAEAFFNPAVLVDTPLRTEFFKHLPGILTGIGIIGTFFGLLEGLQEFKVSSDSAQLQSSLALLMHGVWEAFVASSAAIGAAMAVTFLEKLLLNWCYSRTEELAQAIDCRYQAGAGEEYLSRLVSSAEESAVQTRLLKDALVNDLKELLTNFSDGIARSVHEGLADHSNRLIEAQSSIQGELASAIRDGLSEPMQAIARATQSLGGNQGEAVNDLLSATLAKIDDTFGSQMRGINEAMTQNAGLMANLQGGFRELLDGLKRTGEDANSALAEHLRTLMSEAEQRQQQMNATLLGVLEQIRTSTEQARSEGDARLQQTLDGVIAKVDALLGRLDEQQRALGQAGETGLRELQDGLAALVAELREASQNTGAAFETELKRLLDQTAARQGELGESVRALVDEMRAAQGASQETLNAGVEQTLADITAALGVFERSAIEREAERAQGDATRAERLDQTLRESLASIAGQVETLATQVSASTGALQSVADRLEAVTVRGADSLTSGASAIGEAAARMQTAGERVTGVLDGATALQGRIAQTANGLETAGNSLREVIHRYYQKTEQMEALANTLRGLIDDSERRAGISRDLVKDMERMVEHARELQGRASHYLDQVGDALGKGFESFADAVTVNMGRARGEFDKSLGEAVKMIAGTVEELDAALVKLTKVAQRG